MLNKEQIKSEILSAYLSTDSPNYSFVMDRYNSQIYKEFISELSTIYSLEENTDLNYDVCLSLQVNIRKKLFVVQLSLVGKYAVILTSNGQLANKDDQIKDLQNLLKKHEIVLLEKKELLDQIKFQLEDKLEDVPIYKILFSYDDTPSWML